MAPEDDVRALHRALLDRWNARDAAGFAGCLARDGSIVGFDGSMVDGAAAVESHLAGIFSDHEPATYVGAVREVRALADGAVLLRAVAGMVPPGQTEVKPEVNAVQSVVAVEQAGEWRVALFQTTPAAFHGRPDDAERLTRELQALVQSDG